MSEIQHSIKVAARRCGLSTHVIRVWEKRYDAVSPDRTDTNRRLYSEAEIERLTLLRQVTQAGYTISNVARLPIGKLRELVSAPLIAESALPARRPATDKPEMAIALTAIRELDPAGLESAFERQALDQGPHGLLENFIAPLAVKVGELWQRGELTAAHEHFASGVIRGFLLRHSRPYALNGSTPTIVVATPAGQLHEIGAVMVAATANDMGWRVVYLGTSLPALEIAGAVLQHKARAVALSIVFPGDDPDLPGEIENLRRFLPPETCIIAGGNAAGSYESTFKKCGAVLARELHDLYPILGRLRVPKA